MEKYGLIGLLMVSVSTFAAEDCSRVEDREERLACFDRLYPSEEAIIRSEPVDSVESIAPAMTPVLPASSKEASTSELSVESKPPKAAGQPPHKRWSLFGEREKVIITATITDVLERETQKMVFQLSNGQIWLQTSPRNLPIGIGDEVTIKSGMIGGYIMRSSSGTSTRVQLID